MAETTDTPWFERKPELPAWFDDKVHSAGDGGIFETATGTLLADDGLPASGPLRALREADATPARGARGRAAAPQEVTPDA